MSYAADKQTDKQTASNVLATPTDRVGVGNEKGLMLRPTACVVIMQT